MEHTDVCGSKTRQCFECKQFITLRDLEMHEIDGKCNFYKELEAGKAMRELAKFQEQEAMRIKKMQLEETKKQRQRKEDQLIQT